jgi:hypothetical protein
VYSSLAASRSQRPPQALVPTEESLQDSIS